MPVFLAALIGALASAAASLAGRVLIGVGIGVVAYTGLSSLITGVSSDIQTQFAGAPSLVLQVLGTLRLDTCIAILLSAYTARYTLAGLTSGTLVRWIKK